MDDRRFDRLARALAATGSRRAALLGALAVGATAVAGYRRSDAQEADPTPAADEPAQAADQTIPAAAGTTLCAGDGQPCVMLTGCCDGFTCVTSAINPNQGFCQSGGTGGVQIAAPTTGDASAQPAPTSTPHRRTHSPGDKKNNNTNTHTSRTKELYDLRVTLNCTGTPEVTTIRNAGSQDVTLSKFIVPDNPAYADEDGTGNDVFTPAGRAQTLKSGRKIRFFSNTRGMDLTSLPNGFVWSQDKVYLNGDADQGVKVFTGQQTDPFTASCGGSRAGSGHKRKHRKNKHKNNKNKNKNRNT